MGSKESSWKTSKEAAGKKQLTGGVRAVPEQSERNEQADEWVRTDAPLNVDCGTASICPALVHPLPVLGISCHTMESDCYLSW